LGYGVKHIDGIIGSGTRKAIRAFQKDNGLVADGFAHPEVFETLNSVYQKQKS
jgi:peptidoglycan hydrolase-like protein with peptidoglycan-binding domain